MHQSPAHSDQHIFYVTKKIFLNWKYFFICWSFTIEIKKYSELSTHKYILNFLNICPPSGEEHKMLKTQFSEGIFWEIPIRKEINKLICMINHQSSLIFVLLPVEGAVWCLSPAKPTHFLYLQCWIVVPSEKAHYTAVLWVGSSPTSVFETTLTADSAHPSSQH